MKKKLIIIISIIIFLVVCFIIILNIFEFNEVKSEKKLSRQMTLSNNFPDEYKPYVDALKSKYPNWEFKALYTNLDWNYVIKNENIYGKNLVPKSYSDSWKNTTPGQYNVEVDSGWVDSSKSAVEFAMDPRNFINYVRIFQFEELSYNSSTNKVASIEKILYGTEFYNKIVEYKTSSGNNIVTNKKYSELILSAAQTSKVSSFHLASRIKQEVGPFLSHSSISGTVSGYEGLYNFYNIGATSSSEPMGAIINGLKYAKDGKGASESTKAKYLIPWNTKERAITGGGIFIGSSYINSGQNTIYLQKFHVYDTGDGELFWHQYMTNVLAPYSESKIIYTGYQNSNMLDTQMSFVIPIYENMPELPCMSPAISSTDFTKDNTKVYANVETSLNVRCGPGTSYESLTTIPAGTKMTRIAKGKQKGELWDRVKLENGLVGYVFQNYVKEDLDIEVEKIELSVQKNTINKGESLQISSKILPENATNKTLTYTSNNTKIATVSSNGKITGISSGTATITAKSKNGISANITITVYSPVTDILISNDNIVMQKEKTLKISAIILPEDASNKNINYKSENEIIAKVDNEGNLTGISEGNTNIIVSAEEGKITKSIKVTVTRKLEDGEIIFDESLNINGNEITGLENKNNTADKIVNKIQTNYTVEIYNKEGKKLTGNDLVGTGGIIKILENNLLITEYEIILYGDANGDGKINSVDLLVIQRHILEIQKLQSVYLKAGNVRKNNKNPSSVDCLLIQRHILGLQNLEQ